MSIIDKNKLIAEFMGVELEETLNHVMVYAIKWSRFPHDTTEMTRTEFYTPEELEYNKSRIWLRNVRLKIRDLGESIEGRYLGKMYRDIVDFIVQYNKTNF